MAIHKTETIKLKEVLEQTRQIIVESEFCGIGVIVYSDFSLLPVFPLCHHQEHMVTARLVEQIASASRVSNPCHDGFHLVSLHWQLTHRNQYFAPPIDLEAAASILPGKDIGARYLSALLGSKLPGVICTGIVSERDGLVIFENGGEFAFT